MNSKGFRYSAGLMVIPATLVVWFIIGQMFLENCPREPHENLVAAREMARMRAMQFSTDTIPLVTMADSARVAVELMDVRAREHKLRSLGHSLVAKVYMETFLATLDTVNPSLAKELR